MTPPPDDPATNAPRHSARWLTPDALVARLTARPPSRSAAKGRAAAVLIAFSAREGEPYVTLIKRPQHMRQHRGQYAFPGGGRDPTDASLVDTALREAHEEIGIAAADVRVLGTLDDLPTITGYVVTPVVGWIPDGYRYEVNRGEVDLVVELPLHAFLAPPRSRNLLYEGLTRVVLAYDIDGHFIWGATARIVRNLVTVIASESHA